MRDDSSSSTLLDHPTPGANLTGTGDGDVPPLNYVQLRTLAESALGLGQRGAYFFVNQGQVMWVPAADPVTLDGVLVPAYQTGKYEVMDEVLLKVKWPESDGVSEGRGSVDAVQVHADAVFWSDAAVHKFVFPYLASCAGHAAVQKLTSLRDAWNAYPGDSQVFALLHVTSLPGEAPLSVEDSFLVAFVQRTQTLDGEVTSVQTQVLSKFAPLPTGTLASEPASPDAVPYQQPPITMQAAQYPDYKALRAIAEFAESITPGTQYLTWDPEHGVLGPYDTRPETVENRVVIPACTAAVPSTRLQPFEVVIRPARTTSPWTLFPGQADAVFWTAGSIQQFMFPYYASKQGYGALVDLPAIHDAWEDNAVRAPVIGPHGTASGAAQAAVTGGDDAPSDETTTTEVYGLVHLPKSEWAEMTESSLQEPAGEGVVKFTERERHRLTHSALLKRIDPHSALYEVGAVHSHPDFGLRLLPLAYFSVLYPKA